MNNSSAQQSYSITFDDTIDLSGITAQDISSVISDTITITGSGGSSDCIVLDFGAAQPANTVLGYSATSTGISNVSIGAITTADISFTNDWIAPEEFVDTFPDFDRIQKMCEQYPGLKIAFEKFKTTYKLVKDDYDTPKDKRIKP